MIRLAWALTFLTLAACLYVGVGVWMTLRKVLHILAGGCL